MLCGINITWLNKLPPPVILSLSVDVKVLPSMYFKSINDIFQPNNLKLFLKKKKSVL